MRHLALHLRQFLVHNLGRLALDPRAYTELLKVGAFKAGGAVTAGLLIPVTALATYSIPARAIERITAPLVSAAPDVFDVRSLGRLSQARLRDLVQAPGSIGRALGGPTDTFDPGSSDQSLTPADVLAAGDPGLFGAGSVVDQLAPPEATPGGDADPGTSDGPAPDAGSGAGGSVQGSHDPDPTIDEVTSESDEDDQDVGAGQGGDSAPDERQDPVGDQEDKGDDDPADDGAGELANQDDQASSEPGDIASDVAQGGPEPEASGNSGQADVGSGNESAPVEDQGDEQIGDDDDDQGGDEGTGDDQGDHNGDGHPDNGNGNGGGNGNNGNGNGNGNGGGDGNNGNDDDEDKDKDDHNGDGYPDNGHGHS